MINSYTELILEKRINETNVYFSPDFRNTLKKIDSKISSSLLDIEGDDIKPNITFIDNDSNGYASFTTIDNVFNKVGNFLTNRLINTTDQSLTNRLEIADQIHDRFGEVYTDSRNSIKIGKLINKLLPNQFGQKELEEFVNNFKANVTTEEMEIVTGDDIAYWYNGDNYYDNEQKGALYHSCMKDKPASFFEIYTKNPEVCSMLIIKKDDKLVARALVWKLSYNSLNDDIEYFLDKQYYNKNYQKNKLINYAKEKGWAYRVSNDLREIKVVSYNNQTYNDVDMEVELKRIDYDTFPYVDTLKVYDHGNHVLNNYDEDECESCYILEYTDGGFYDRNLEFDGWNETYEDIDDLTYSEVYGFFIRKDEEITVVTGINDYNRPILKEGYNIGDENVEEFDVDSNWAEGLEKLSKDWTIIEPYILRNLLVMNSEYDLIPKKYRLFLFKVIKTYRDDIDLEYITREDSILLNFGIDVNDVIVVDTFTYEKTFEHLLPKLIKIANDRLKELNNQLKGKGQLSMEFDKTDVIKNINTVKLRKKQLQFLINQ